MRTKNKKHYVSPVVSRTETVLLEPAMLSDSALAGIMYFTDGVEVDGYYTSDDIATYWE